MGLNDYRTGWDRNLWQQWVISPAMPLIPALWGREAEAETGRSLEFKDNQGLKIKLHDSKKHYKKKS